MRLLIQIEKDMKMRELSMNEVQQVSGAGPVGDTVGALVGAGASYSLAEAGAEAGFVAGGPIGAMIGVGLGLIVAHYSKV